MQTTNPQADASARPGFPWRGWATALVTLYFLWWCAAGTGVSLKAFAEGLPEVQEYFARLLPSAQRPWPLDYLPQVQQRMLETIRMALAASIFGAIVALPFALIGSRNLAGRAAYAFGRTLLNLIRTIPDLVWASLLASAFGIGPLAGICALFIFTWGVVAKLLCDTIETIDPGPIEVITATGGTRLQRFVYAVIPQVAPDYIAYTLYAFEINVRSAAVLGLVGAGGIGVILQRDIAFLAYQRVGLIIAVTFVVVLLIDSFSTWLRSRLV